MSPWEIRFSENAAAQGWQELSRLAPADTRWAWLTIRRNPAPLAASAHHHRLHDQLATGTVQGCVLDHWQLEVTEPALAGAVRGNPSPRWIRYLVDPAAHTVWIEYAGPGHYLA